MHIKTLNNELIFYCQIRTRELSFWAKRKSLDLNIFPIGTSLKDILGKWDHRNSKNAWMRASEEKKIGSDRQFKMNWIESLHQMAFGKWNDINLVLVASSIT